MLERQVRIFASSGQPDEEGWAESIIGNIIKPVIAKFGDRIPLFWFSRYAILMPDREEPTEEELNDIGDCAFWKIPKECRVPGKFHRSIRFRFSVENNSKKQVEDFIVYKVASSTACISGIIEYSSLVDLGGDRFAGPSCQDTRGRSILVFKYLNSICRLVLDYLYKNRDIYKIEENDQLNLNPDKTAFQSLHHLLCNITGVPTFVPCSIDSGAANITIGVTTLSIAKISSNPGVVYRVPVQF